MNLNSPIEQLSKLPKPQLAALKKLGITTIQDLLLYLPYRYLDFSKTLLISELKQGEPVTLKGKIKSISSRFSFRGRINLAEAIISDKTGSIKVVWFNQPYLAKSLMPGEEIFLAGEPEIYKNILQFTNPIYEKASEFPVHTSRLLPLYHLTAKLYHKTLRNLVANALPHANNLTEVIPEHILINQKLPNLTDTVHLAHFPQSEDDVIKAKKRLAFEEIFVNQLAAQQYKLKLAQKKAYTIKFERDLIKSFIDSLPFKLTQDQKKAAWDALQDLEKQMPANRLLEGDVGSGKTLVALIAVLQTIARGFQVAFLAPTEILAKQHYNTAINYFKVFFESNENVVLPFCDGRHKMAIGLLTNNYVVQNNALVSKPSLQKTINTGCPGLYIGTHALLQSAVNFKNLALVIVDEQHRFGVEQRAALLENGKKVPHLLSLSATPIPRSLQLAFYGELDVSQIKEKPANRKPIITRLAPDNKRKEAYDFIKKQIQGGRQAFVITPLIEESDKLGVKSAKKEVDNLKTILPEFKIGLLHGRMKGKEKEAVMNEFLENKIQILVSTSVVEVGVDAPNASIMLIEGAERFGLAQLHQFRGRVGRAEHQSYCILFRSELPFPIHGEGPGKRLKNDEQGRLELFTKTQDGFKLAELDLKLRGFGELYGQSQSGWDFKYFDPNYTSLIPLAREEAKKLLLDDIDLQKHPALKAKIAEKTIHFE